VGYTILWSGPALDDLRSIKDYVSRDKPKAARRLAERISRCVLDLAEFPEAGRPVPEFPDSGYREVIVAPYRIIYEVTDDRVIVLRVWHGRRDLTQLERKS
jgi:addiction module RelE/StbE family toxin